MLGPGVLAAVANYSTCPGDISDGDGCFSRTGTPTTQCRAFEDLCSVSQSVASTLSVESIPAQSCHRYVWGWTCAFQRRLQCGIYWCDPISECLANGTCVCPHPLRGDPVLQNCVCATGAYYNGTACVEVGTCPTTTSTSMAPTAAECTQWWSNAAPWIIIACVLLAGGLYNMIAARSSGSSEKVQHRTASIPRHHRNGVYVTESPVTDQTYAEISPYSKLQRNTSSNSITSVTQI